MFIDNNWYGNRFILSRYCKIKDKLALASIQHGLFLPKNDLNFYKRTFQIFPWLVWDKKLKKNTEHLNQKNVECIGAPFLYLHDILKQKIKSKGTLIIPAKSSYENNEEVDFKKLINFVKNKFPKPYTILVGYFDLERVKKIRHNYRNCKFATCGKRGNKFFTDNLYKYINKHDNVAIFYVGSPILYSLFLKKKTFFFFNRFIKISTKKSKRLLQIKAIKKQLGEDRSLVNRMIKNYNLNFKNLNTKKNQKNAGIALGIECKKKSQQLIKLLGWDNNIKFIIAYFLHIIIKIRYFYVKRNF